jgi:uncharacterized repeat protein (TIGR01451 family)
VTLLQVLAGKAGALAERAGRRIARLGLAPARLALRIRPVRLGVQCKALQFAAGVLVAASSFAATPPNTDIVNTATASYSVSGAPVTVNGSVTVKTVARTPSAIEFLQFVPATAPSAGAVESLAPAQCSTSGSGAGPFVPSTGPIPLGSSTALAVPGDHRLTSTNYFHGGEAVFVKLTDLDQNLDPNAAESVLITLRSTNGDSELLRLTETGPSTGVFIGYIQSTFGPVVTNDCRLSVALNTNLTANYVDVADGSDSTADGALVDPFGIVFDSVTGNPVNGATVTLINTATGAPAQVFCDDGVTLHPSSVTSGAPLTACGTTVTLPAGGYRFPLAAPGTYLLHITAPAGYAFPSTVSTSTLQTLPGAPFAIVTGSRGENFMLNPGPAVQIDVPLDPANADLQIVKTAIKAVVGIGELTPYALVVRNLSATAQARDARIVDRLPPGFRYRRGSARLNGAPLADPQIGADGRTLTFSVGTLAAGGTLTLGYAAEVTAGARAGIAENTAQAAAPISSNVARASVLVREDLFRERAILVGRVAVGECGDPNAEPLPGLVNARIVLEDGRTALTDREGRWHLDNIRPGTHVVALDLDSLPAGYEVLPCQDNSRFAGRKYSQFVNLRGGSLWRADFTVRRTGAAAAPAVESAAPPKSQTRSEALPYDEKWLAAAPAGVEWLHPHEGFNPAIPAIKAAVKHDPTHLVVLELNGSKVSALNYDGMLVNPARTAALSTWRGISLRDGTNVFRLTVTDAAGNPIRQETRTIHYASIPAKAEFVAAKSKLAADGKSRPVIAVRFTDKDGRPVRAGVSGEFRLNEPYQGYDPLQAIERDPLAGRIGGTPRFEIGDDGVALIELAPTTKVGEAVLTFALSERQRQEIRVWLTPGEREWILVGFAEGTIGHKRLTGNMEALRDADADDRLFDGNRVAFYAKGQIKGDALLTVAYDSAKERGSLDAETLKQAIDPNRFYTLYGDATEPQFDAASIRKLYLRIEKSQFYALFGDYDTGLTVTELARYTRTLNGLKSEYQGRSVGYNVFATTTAQAYVRDELRGDGTSGLYQLSRRNILINSDKVRIEARDRFRSEVIVSARTLTRYLDYDIDHALGTLRFREPIPSRDEHFNPIYIVAEYEAADPGDEKATYGGRVAVRPHERIEVGATHVHEGNVGARGDLTGVDVSARIDDKTTLKSEYARSDRERAGLDFGGDAWKVEVVREDKDIQARAYARQQDPGFGLGQQAVAETGTREVGGDARVTLSEDVRLDGQVYRQEVLTTGAQRDLAEGLVQWQRNAWSLSAGARAVNDVNATGKETESYQLLGGGAVEVLDRRLRLRASAEVGVGAADASVDYPNRLLLGADVKLTALTSAFAEQEFARGENLSSNMTRIGMKTALWSGAEAIGTVGNELVNDGTRLYSGLGLTQKWQINKNWQADFLVDRTQTLKVEIAPLNPAVPLASGSLAGDHTAIAVGAGYLDDVWSGNGRVEWRESDIDDKVNVLLGAQRQLAAGRTVAAGFLYSRTDSALARTRRLDGRASYALRPNGSRWIVLDRFDVIEETLEAALGTVRTRKLVNNVNANYTPDSRTQWSFQYGAKYVFDRIGGADYSGYTDLIGVEVRRDLDRHFDVGVNAGALHSWSSDVMSYSAGVSVGYRVVDNVWFAVGYNFLGFTDRDFAGAEYRAKGVYLALRAKFDQDTLGLNKLGAFTRRP